MRAALFLSLLTACGSPAVVAGDIGNMPFEKARSAWHGTSLIIIADEDIPCDQMGWASRAYNEGEPADGRRSFTALQIAFRNEIAEGAFLPDRAQGVAVDGLVNGSDSVDVLHAREGEILIEDAGNNVTGTFSIAFADSGTAGEFTSEFCVNVP